MQVISKRLTYDSRKDRFFYLVPLGDMHFGHPNCDVDLFLKARDYIIEKHNCYWIGMGDYCDAISPSDRRFDMHSIDPNYATPDKQYRWVEEQLKPIKDKCLGLLTGNHDILHWKKHGHDYVDGMAYAMEVPYLMDLGYIRLFFERVSTNGSSHSTTFNILAEHGCTAARETSAKVGRIEDMADRIPGLDLYLMGHTHVRGASPPRTQLFINKELRVTSFEENFCFTGSYLKGYLEGKVSYVEEMEYKPTTLGSPLIQVEVEPEGHFHERPMVSFSVAVSGDGSGRPQ